MRIDRTQSSALVLLVTSFTDIDAAVNSSTLIVPPAQLATVALVHLPMTMLPSTPSVPSAALLLSSPLSTISQLTENEPITSMTNDLAVALTAPDGLMLTLAAIALPESAPSAIAASTDSDNNLRMSIPPMYLLRN